MFGVFDDKVRSVDTRGVDGTFLIGVSFIFIAYFLYPLVESSYHRVRAYRAWRALEKRKSVEVTNYPMLAETLGGRGKWDTARIVTVLLAVFSLVSWGLELSMGLAHHQGKADLLDRSPSVTVETFQGNEVWEVKPEGDYAYNGDWEKDFNMNGDRALSMYEVTEADTCRGGRIKGTIKVAFWSDDPEKAPADLYYNQTTTANATVKNLRCAEGQNDSKDIHVRDADDIWGTVVTCNNGPKQSNFAAGDNDRDGPPTLILNSSAGETFLVMEESSNYPKFMYSVWTNGIQHDDSVELNHLFHIAATVRLAEAVVTAIVQNKKSGFDCFLLVRVNSESGHHSNSKRAKPFGEDPTNALVKIENLETIECGLELDLKALIYLVILTLLTAVGISWSFCLRSSIVMNVYDRDELIRAVSMAVDAKRCSSSSAIRIFVRKEDSGCLSVVISDAGDAETGCGRFFSRTSPVDEDTEPAPDADPMTQFNKGGGDAVPLGRPTAWLGAVRFGKGRPWPDRPGTNCHPDACLTVSPAPPAGSSGVGTPIHDISPLARVPREVQAFPGGRGISHLFDGSLSPSDNGEDDPGNIQPGRRNDGNSRSAPGARVVAPSDPRGASAMPQGDIEMPSLSDRGARTNGLPHVTHPPYMMVPGLSDRGVRTNGLLQGTGFFHTMVPRRSDHRRIGPRAPQVSSTRSTSQASGGSSPVAPFQRDSTLGPPPLDPLTRGSGDETEEQT